MTDTSDAPAAYRRSTPNPSTRSGTITTPPPSPVSAPSRPAANAPPATRAVISSPVMPPLLRPPLLGRAVLRPGQVQRRVHQADVRERLREVAHLPPEPWV